MSTSIILEIIQNAKNEDKQCYFPERGTEVAKRQGWKRHTFHSVSIHISSD